MRRTLRKCKQMGLMSSPCFLNASIYICSCRKMRQPSQVNARSRKGDTVKSQAGPGSDGNSSRRVEICKWRKGFLTTFRDQIIYLTGEADLS